MAAFNKFDSHVQALAEGVHQYQAAGHTFKAYLSNATPSASADSLKADLAEISTFNGYTSGGHDIQNDTSRSGGTLSVTAVDIVLTATSGGIGPFRYVVIYNDTPTSPADPLVGWYDYGSAITIADGETFTIDFGSSLFTLA
jgi:hypothetical protein